MFEDVSSFQQSSVPAISEAIESYMDSTSRTRDTIALLKLVIQALVSDKAEVSITLFDTGEEKVFLQVKVSDRDRGKVIGRGGRIARSIRIVFRGIEKQQGARYQIDFLRE